MSKTLAIALVVVLGACDDTTPAWQLEHDRIIAVRATPPTVAPRGRVDLDVLVTAVGEGPSVVQPMQVALISEALSAFTEGPGVSLPSPRSLACWIALSRSWQVAQLSGRVPCFVCSILVTAGSWQALQSVASKAPGGRGVAGAAAAGA